MQPVATYAFMLSQLRAINNTTALSQKYSTQLSTGNASQDLSGLAQHNQVLNLNVVRSRTAAYVTTCTLSQTTTAQYDQVLSDLETQVKTALESVKSVQSTYTGTVSIAGSANQSEADASAAFSDLSQTLTQIMKTVTIDLNEKSSSGNGYLFSGLRTPTSSPSPAYSTPPVTDLTALPYFTGTNSPAPNPAGTTIAGYTPADNAVDTAVTAASGLPVYDADYSTWQSANAADQSALATLAHGTRQVTIADDQTVDLGISADNQAFQDLVNGLRAAKTAADQAGTYTTDDRDAFIALANSSLNSALNGIRALEHRNSINDTALEKKTDWHNQNLSLLQTHLESLTGVDTTEVTVKLAAATDQLEASYKVTSGLLGLSLLDYLK
ncbi:MAG: hypothetical protein GC191_15930 [Azospirillum sp.]|nr:hypothetical protein [Azospirillum sp.]